jgi:dihydrofolate synthase/folylpolyglutamate synthase
MNYTETLEYLYEHLPMYQRIGAAAYKKDLTNTLGLCAHLGQPHEAFKTIHVAGTNGKGSVSHLLAGLYQQTGLKVGLYTSPHYIHFGERIKVNGVTLSEEFLIDWVARHKDFIEWLKPSFFEMSVALAFDYFKQQAVDIAVIEVGLGGRLDSTNVISPMVSVITNIGYDHMNLLGNTLPQIAAEKAGIIKPHTPVVIGSYQPELHEVFVQRARAAQAPLTLSSDVIEVSGEATDIFETARVDVLYKKRGLILEGCSLFTGAPWMWQNVTTALAALEILADSQPALPYPTQADIIHTLAHLPDITGIMGRWQILNRQPLVIADSAHNAHGLAPTLEALKKVPGRHLHIVLGVVNDKDLTELWRLLPLTDTTYYFCKADIPRGLPADVLQAAALRNGATGIAYTSVAQAYTTALEAAQPDHIVFVGGSIFTVGEVLACLKK